MINKVNEVVRISKLDDEINNKIKKFIYIIIVYKYKEELLMKRLLYATGNKYKIESMRES